MAETVRSLYSHSVAGGSILKPSKFISEIAMEGYLIENPALLSLREDDEPEIKDFECNWEKIDKSKGRIDLLVDYGDKSYAVIELKKGKIDKDAFDQLKSYMSKEHLTSVAESYFGVPFEECVWEGVLVGSDFDSGLESLLVAHNKATPSLPFAAIALRRFSSDSHLYALTDVLYPNTKKKDNSRYSIDGDPVPYKKANLVLACVKHYIKRNPGSSFEALRGIVGVPRGFSDKCPVLLGHESLRGHTYGGFYAKDILSLGGSSFVVYSGWMITQEDIYLDIAKRLGCTITKEI